MMKPEAFPFYDNEALDEGSAVTSYSGIQVDTSGPNWVIGVDSVVYWQPFEILHSDLLSALKTYARHLIQTSSPAHVENQLGFMKRLGDTSVAKSASDDLEKEGYVTRRTYNAFAALLNGVVADVHHSNYLGAFIRWYLWCADCGLPGFDEDVAADLDSVRLKAAPRSAAVMRQDPQSGPLRRSEYEPLEIALRSQRATELPLVDRVVAWLFLCFGTNPRNLTLLAEDDFITTALNDGSVVHELRIPRIKKRTPGERDQFRTRRLVPELAELIDQLIKQNRDVADDSAQEAFRPLLRGIERKALLGTPFAPHRFRMQVGDLGAALQIVSAVFGLKAHDGSPLHLTPRRLRYTFATKLVADGASPQEVADALDHSDTGYVMVYFNTRSDVVQRLDKAMGLALAPIAQAFMGVIVDDETGATRARDRNSRIKHYSPTMKSLENVGSCGSFGFCGLMAPIACYTCTHFQAWLDGPHEHVLDELERKRNERLAAGADPKMTQIHDRTMLAVAEVIVRCNARRDAEAAA
jgi:integrase